MGGGAATVAVSIVAIHEPKGGSKGLGYLKKLLALVDDDCPAAGMSRGQMVAILDAARLELLPQPLSEAEVRRMAEEARDGSWTLLFERPIRHDIQVAT